MKSEILQSETSAQSAELFRLIVENIKDYAVFMTDIEGRLISWNPSVERLLGYSEKEFIGLSVAIIFSSEDVKTGVPAREMENAVQTGCAEDKRWYRRQDGSLFWANGMLMPLKNDDGTLRGYAKIMRDDTTRKLSEKNLEQSKRRFESILSSVSDSFYTFDREFRYVYVNEATTKMFGLPETAFLGKTLWELFPDVKGNKFHSEIARALKYQKTVVFENYYPPLNRWFENRVYPSADGLSVFTTEITDRKFAEEALRESEERYRTLFNSIDEGFCVIEMLFDENGKAFDYRFLEINPSFVKLTGISAADALKGKTIRELIPNFDEKFFEIYGRIAVTGVPERFAEVSRAIGGHWFDIYAFRIGEADSRKVAVLFNNISERKQAEESLVKSSSELERQTRVFDTTLSSISDLTYIFNNEGRFAYANQALLTLLEISLEEIVGKNFFDLNYPPELAERLQNQIQQVFGSKERLVDETQFTAPNNITGYFEYILSPVIGSDGNVEIVVGSTRDITERKRSELNFAFLAGVSQDLTRLSDVETIIHSMSKKIGIYFGVSNCAFIEVDTAANTANINYIWRRDETAVDFTGSYNLSEFVSDQFRQNLIDGKPIVVNNVETDSHTSKGSAKFQALKIASFINSPFVSDGILSFVLGVYRETAYQWRGDEIELLGELMTRVWTRIERARAEENLRDSEERFRALQQATPDGFMIFESVRDQSGGIADFRWVYVNPAAEKIVGRSGTELHGKLLCEEMPGNRADGLFDHYARVVETGSVWQNEFGYKHENLDHYFLSTAVKVGDGFAVGFSNVTERKRAEEKIHESEENFRNLANSISQLAWMADASGSIFWYNKRWFDYTGTTLEQMKGWGWQAVHHPEEVGRVTEKFKRHVASSEIWEDTFPLLSKNGEFRWFLSRAIPIRNEQGEIFRWFGTNTDVEELREARLQAEQANRLKDEFLATLSHELRTPLNAILGWSQMLQNRQISENEAKKALATIERSARSQNQLIDDLLDVSRITTGKLRLNVRAVDLPSVIAAAIDSARPAAEAKNIRLQTLLDPQAGPISGDPDRIQQIVWNLLTNAVKFTPRNGRVQVRLERINSHVEIVVSDTGKGIESEFLPFVFDRFRQSDGSMTRRHGGLGLGLAIARQLVELHGGQISVYSAGEGEGATFTVNLPLLPVRNEPLSEVPRVHPTAQNALPIDCPPELTGLYALLVDDEADSRDLLSSVLELCGATVTTVGSAVEAIQMMTVRKFDVIISDIGMPEEDGFSLITKIRELPNEKGGNTPAIALTAYARAEDRVKALRSGFQMHIAKPVESSELIAAVANLAGRTRNQYLNQSETF